MRVYNSIHVDEDIIQRHHHLIFCHSSPTAGYFLGQWWDCGLSMHIKSNKAQQQRQQHPQSQTPGISTHCATIIGVRVLELGSCKAILAAIQIPYLLLVFLGWRTCQLFCRDLLGAWENTFRCKDFDVCWEVNSHCTDSRVVHCWLMNQSRTAYDDSWQVCCVHVRFTSFQKSCVSLRLLSRSDTSKEQKSKIFTIIRQGRWEWHPPISRQIKAPRSQDQAML